MNRTLPQQSRFKVVAHYKKGAVDITALVGDNASIEVEVLKISHLTFELKDPDDNAHFIRIGTKIDFYGGYVDSSFFTDPLGSSNSFKKLFSGNVRRIKLNAKEDGTNTATIEALDASYSIEGYSAKTFIYPSKNCTRKGANTTSLKTSEIVKIIAEEAKMDIDVILGENTDTEYTLTNPIVQKNMSDFAFLNYLAKRNACYVWTDMSGKTYFVDKSKAHGSINKDIEFVWVGRNGKNFYNSSVNKDPIGTSEYSKISPNQILLTSVDLTEDPAIYGQNITKITYFDDTDGQGKNIDILKMYDESKDEITYYELDTPKVEAMQKSKEGSETLNKILSMGALDIPWDIAQQFYKPIKITKKLLDAIEGQALGITVTASCPGNVNIIPQRSYPINGISRYSSMNIKHRHYFMRTLTHSWNNGDFTTEMEFRC